MTISCPHCHAEIVIDQATLAALQGHAHFECPACNGLVPVPLVTRAPVKITASAVASPNPSLASGRPPANAIRGLNRNLLILGTLTLIVLGGIGFFLASQKTGDTTTVNQNIRNEIINNSYFTQLIADGITTMSDLESIGDIRPYGDDFIGISKEALTWDQTQDLAKRTGASVLAVDGDSIESKMALIQWLGEVFESHLTSSVWVIEQGEPAVLSNSEVLAVSKTEGLRKTFLRWRTVENKSAGAATRDRPFVNSIDMKFVPVPGTNILMCIHETRRQDYALYAKEKPDVNGEWRDARHEGIPCGDKDDHPVVSVNWFDAQAFCEWLGRKEGKTYRLPTDREWSIAAGIGQDENWAATTTPATVMKNTVDYPWGKEWPQPQGCGNYMDISWNNKILQGTAKYPGIYSDGFPTTAPVMSFKPNALGLYDLGGNLWEWCEDWYDGEKYGIRVLRGASWADTATWGGYDGALLSSFRARHTPNIRYPFNGFRVVLDLGESKSPIFGATLDNPLRRKLVESVLSKGGGIKIRKGNGFMDVTRMENLPETFEVHHLDQVNGDFDDADADLLAHFPELESIRLNGCSLSRLPLEELPELQSIELQRNRIPSENLRHLPHLLKLNRLYLYEGRLNRKIVEIVAQCQGLESLYLGNVGLLDGDLEPLTKLARLKNIILRCNLSDKGLEPLARMFSLERVELQDVNPITVTLAPFQSLQVKEFGFFISKITPAMLENIAMMPRLTTFTIGEGEITGGTLQPLFGAKQLESIHLGLDIDKTAVDELRTALPSTKITSR